MKNVITLYKNEGETPLECVNRFRNDHPDYRDIPMTYAGRLDPLACGELLVLAGEKVHEKEAYCACDKEYYVEALLGIETDTYDVLGILLNTQTPTPTLPLEGGGGSISETLEFFIGKQKQTYPPYSSRTVDGKPLWQWAREGRLDEIQIPTREVEIYEISNIQSNAISSEEILTRIDAITDLVQGDFRQEEIKKAWHVLKKEDRILFSFQVKCSSGTYIRTLVHELGKSLGAGACIFRLERTKIFTE